MPRLLAALLLALAFTASACLSATTESPPGDVQLGTYAFQARAVDAGTTCPRVGHVETSFDGGIAFSGTLTRNSVDGRAYLTIGSKGLARDAGFDGQVLTSVHREPTNQAALCGASCTGLELEESLEVALLSPSQDEAAGGACPVPGSPGVPDGGVRPVLGAEGLDAVRACGRLVDRIIVTAAARNCTCTSCDVTHHLEGTRE